MLHGDTAWPGDQDRSPSVKLLTGPRDCEKQGGARFQQLCCEGPHQRLSLQ